MRNVLTAAFLSLISINSIADISVGDDANGQKIITISGQITPSDYSTLIAKEKEILSGGKKLSQIVDLDSPGGDLMTAIKIGRHFRQSKIYYRFVRVWPDAICASSCVFLLAAGIHKWPDEGSKIIIHRPFVDNDSMLDKDKQKKRYKKIEKIVKDYLEEVNVDSRLYDDMFRIDSDSGKLLSEDELFGYGLKGDDPFYKEANEARRAKELGISKSDLYKRDAKVESVCSEFRKQCFEALDSTLDNKSKEDACTPFTTCEEDVLHGRR